MRPITYRLIRFSPVPASHPDFRPVVTPTMTAPPTAPPATYACTLPSGHQVWAYTQTLQTRDIAQSHRVPSQEHRENAVGYGHDLLCLPYRQPDANTRKPIIFDRALLPPPDGLPVSHTQRVNLARLVAGFGYTQIIDHTDPGQPRIYGRCSAHECYHVTPTTVKRREETTNLLLGTVTMELVSVTDRTPKLAFDDLAIAHTQLTHAKRYCLRRDHLSDMLEHTPLIDVL